jgi:ubiquinone/menaquinone biosynthesis C-methylase UbiE
MNHKEAGSYWNESADVWTKLARAGYDIYRDHLNTPAAFAMLPDVAGLRGLDIGCGEGHNTRLLTARGARMTAVDIAETFIAHASTTEREQPLGISYEVASAVELPFAEATFDFATAFMSLMDVPETQRALAEAYRVLKTGGFLQFSISHPCFDTPHRRNLRDDNHRTYAIEVGDYFRNREGEIDEWLFKAAPREVKQGLRKFRLPLFSRTLSQWLNMIVATGFQIEHVTEPQPTDETVALHPGLQDAQVVAYFLHMRVRKRCQTPDR